MREAMRSDGDTKNTKPSRRPKIRTDRSTKRRISNMSVELVSFEG